MSGGKFLYKQYEISNIVYEIEEMLNNQGADIPRDELGRNTDYYEFHPEEAKYPVYSEVVQNMFKLAILNLRVAFAFTHRIDYFLSGDDSEDSFLNKLNEDLEEVIKNDNEACGFSLIEEDEVQN